MLESLISLTVISDMQIFRSTLISSSTFQQRAMLGIGLIFQNNTLHMILGLSVLMLTVLLPVQALENVVFMF